MQKQREFESGLRGVVREVISSIVAAPRSSPAVEPLIETMRLLPLQRMAQWEQLIRIEVDAYRWSQPVGERLIGHQSTAWIALCSGSGFDRERALRAVTGSSPNAFLLALVLRRLNDWVPEVRRAAREQILVLGAASDPGQIGAVLCSILPVWMEWGRLETAGSQVIKKLLTLPGVAESIKHTVVTSTAGPMAEVLAQVAQTPVLDAHWTVIAREAVQPAVRARAYRSLMDGKVFWLKERRWHWIHKGLNLGRMECVQGQRLLDSLPHFLDNLALAAGDRSAYVRREAAEALAREMGALGSTVLPIARQLAADPVSSIAQRGAYVLQRLEAVNGWDADRGARLSSP